MRYKAVFTDEFLSYFRLDDSGKTLVLTDRQGFTRAVTLEVEVEPKCGKWELVDEAEPRRYGCSECKRLSYTQDNYCSYCGAKMKKRSFLMNWSEPGGYCVERSEEWG